MNVIIASCLSMSHVDKSGCLSSKEFRMILSETKESGGMIALATWIQRLPPAKQTPYPTLLSLKSRPWHSPLFFRFIETTEINDRLTLIRSVYDGE